MNAAAAGPTPELPAITYPADLPVSGRRDDILEALRAHQVVVVAGATGSGKTTQLPKMLLELGKRSIAHTQPRRIAARAVSERVAEELGQEVGGLVGYRVRFTDRVSKGTVLTVMTDGILLNAIHRDADLRAYDAIVIDEAHERSLTVDFLLGYLKRLLPRRPDLTVVVTSATIDPESFARHFAAADGTPAPVIEVSGRTFPVEIRYRPLVGESNASGADASSADPDDDPIPDDRDAVSAIIDALRELEREDPGDVLVFLSGEAEIRDAQDAIEGAGFTGTEVLPLYGRLSAAEQHRVFDTSRRPGIRRRVILATNVAETSLTVPGIRYVIDEGTARISRWSVRSKVQRLPIEPVSQASAAQRAGRSGRVAPGIAIRLYSEEDFLRRPEFTEPEILRTDLAAVLLQMAVLGLGDIEEFPFLTPPDKRGVRDGLALLTELGAIDRSGSVTRVGRRIARLPLDPRLGRMLIAADELGVVDHVIPIVAGLSIQDPRERPAEHRAAADQAHARFVDPGSDFITLLRLWQHLAEQQAALSGSAFRRMLKAEYLGYLRVREWQDVVRQLRIALDLPKAPPAFDEAPNADLIHQAILSGLLARIGILDRTRSERGRNAAGPGAKSKDAKRGPGEYLGSRGARFAIHPSSALAKRRPDAIMSAELVETSRLFARMNAEIDPAWAERWAGDLVTRTYSEPRWDPKRGEAVADERVTLYGVAIIPRRRVRYVRIDPEHARELFSRHALTDGEWDTSRMSRSLTDFHRANAALREHLEEVEERTRRRDLLLDDEAVVAWYRQRIPIGIDSTLTFEKWWRETRKEQPELLTMREADFIDADAEADPALDASQFPTEWVQGAHTLPLSYRHAPGADEDGVTATVPRAVLPELEASGFDWLVPGMREELVTALIRTLPKVLRREVVPAADWARRLVPDLPQQPDGAAFIDRLAAVIKRATFAPVTLEDFDLARLPDHLRMRFQVVDQRGKVLAAGRDLAALQERFARERQAKEAKRLEGAERVAAADVRALSAHPETRALTRDALVRLLVERVPTPVSYVQEHLTAAEKLALSASPYPSTAALFDDCFRAAADDVIGDAPPTDEQGIDALVARFASECLTRMFDTVALVARTLSAARDADRAIRESSSLALMGPLADARSQLDGLVFPGFVSLTGLRQLSRLPVYIEGITYRVGRLAGNLGRDRVWHSEVEQAIELYRKAGGSIPLTPAIEGELRHARWLIEELRLSLFAQHLPTAEPVSLQRIRRALS